jgi:hypothetical protein
MKCSAEYKATIRQTLIDNMLRLTQNGIPMEDAENLAERAMVQIDWDNPAVQHKGLWQMTGLILNWIGYRFFHEEKVYRLCE